MEPKKKTLILGASTNAHRMSHLVTLELLKRGHSVYPLGRRAGSIGSVELITDLPQIEDIHTISLYLNSDNQAPLEDYILGLQPKRIIFNPGAENPALKRKASERGIEAINACTMVMLRLAQY